MNNFTINYDAFNFYWIFVPALIFLVSGLLMINIEPSLEKPVNKKNTIKNIFCFSMAGVAFISFIVTFCVGFTMIWQDTSPNKIDKSKEILTKSQLFTTESVNIKELYDTKKTTIHGVKNNVESNYEIIINDTICVSDRVIFKKCVDNITVNKI